MANLGSATVVVNLSCEMVYIVAQRLRDQGYAPDVAAKCLCGMLGALSHPAFVDTLFALGVGGTTAAATTGAGTAPGTASGQEGDDADDVLGNRGALQAVLQQLCSCSFLLLGEDSMARMLDIQLMTFKYQAMSACSLRTVTRNHLDAMLALAAAAEHTGVRASLAALRARFESAFARLGAGDDADLRMRVLAFLQDQRAEVGMLLADGKMAEDLGINYSISCTEGVPARGEKPGAVRYYDAQGANWRAKAFDPTAVAPGAFQPPADFFDSAPADPPLGGDMFAASEEAEAPPDETPPCPPSDDDDEGDNEGEHQEHGGKGNEEEEEKEEKEADSKDGEEAVVAPNPVSATPKAAPSAVASPASPSADMDEADLMMARNTAIAAALKSLDTVMSNLPAPKLAGPRYNPHHPTDGPSTASQPQQSQQSQPKAPEGAESDLLGKLDQLAAVTEQPTAESLQSALHDLTMFDSSSDNNDTSSDTSSAAAAALAGLDAVAPAPSSAELSAALSDLTALAPADDADMASALASLDSIAAAAPPQPQPQPQAAAQPARDELSAALLGVEAHPDAAALSTLSMLDSVAQHQLQQEAPPAVTAEGLSSALAGLDSTAAGAGDAADIAPDVSLADLSDALSALGGSGDGAPPDSGVFDLSGLDVSSLATDGNAPQTPAPSSAVFDLSGLGDF